MSIQRAFWFTVALLFAAALNVWAYVYAMLNRAAPGAKVSSAECTDTETAAKQNPNKMLFISCGGFLE